MSIFGPNAEPVTTINGVAYRTWQDGEKGISWVEYEPDPEAPWTVTFGFTDRDGALEIAELHIFPTRNDPSERSASPAIRDGEGGRAWGTWAHDPDLVPERGLTRRALQRSMLNFDGALRAALLSRAGFVSAGRRAVEAVPRRQRDAFVLALVAVSYETATRKAFPRNAYIASELRARGIKCAESSVPNLIHDARKGGMLTATRQGRSGGNATENACLLVDAREKVGKDMTNGK